MKGTIVKSRPRSIGFRPRTFASACIALLGIVTAPVHASAQQKSADPSRVARLLRPAVKLADHADTAYAIADRMKSYHVPGLSLAIIDGNRVVYAKGFGITEFGGNTPVDTSTLFLAGSISKPVFATGALALVEQKKLTLDDDVNRYLKSWHLPDSRFTATNKVTLRRLLSHNAGLTVWGFPGYEMGTAVPTVPQLLDGVKPANTAAVRNDTMPGSRWLYSGGGITIAQLMATDVTGEPFPALMKRLVLERSGMVHSTFENPLPRERWREAASGHEKIDTPVPGRFHVYPEKAAAGLWTTASDLARWAISLTRSYSGATGGPISPAMAREMLTSQVHVKPPYGNGDWGLGVALGGSGDSLTFNHGGRDEGFVAQMSMWPNLGRGIVIMTNGVNNNLITEILRGFSEEFDVPGVGRTERRAARLTPDELAKLAGTYHMPNGKDTLKLVVRVSGEMLSVVDPIAMRTSLLIPISADELINYESGTSWKVERDAGTVRAMLIGRAPNVQRAVRQ